LKVLYFDCFSGISGDMTLGALLDLGADETALRNELAKLGLKGYTLNIQKKKQNAIIGTDVEIVVDDVEEHNQEGEHGNTHSHTHSHTHTHGYENGRIFENHHHNARNLMDIEAIIDGSGLKQKVKDFSKKVFREIAKAEAKVHDTDIYDIHFHEVGAIDSIVDIVGIAICLDLLDIKKVFSSVLHDGKGFIECQHGVMPVPVPAVMQMLADSSIPLVQENIGTELVTPTGMGIIKCLAESYGNMPAMMIDKIGYGMGKRYTGKFNALRVVMGTFFDEGNMMEEIAILETNIDNMTPEIMGFTSEYLFKNGALDVFFTPVYMKKNRPAVMLTVLSKIEDEMKLTDIILKHTGTLGVRRRRSKRSCVERREKSVDTELGKVRVKVAYGSDFKKVSPEYEDCREIALKTGIPLSDIYELVKNAYNEEKDSYKKEKDYANKE